MDHPNLTTWPVSEYPLSKRIKINKNKRGKAGEPFLRTVGNSCLCRRWWKRFLLCTLQVDHFSATGLWCFLSHNRQALRGWRELKKWWSFCLLLTVLGVSLISWRRPWRWENSVSIAVIVDACVMVHGSHGREVGKREQRLISVSLVCLCVIFHRPVLARWSKPKLQLFLLRKAMPSFSVSVPKPLSLFGNQI